MMDLLRFKQRQHVAMRLLSPELWRLGVHWFGRTMLCPRPCVPCQACYTERVGQRGFAIGSVRGVEGRVDTGLIELPQSAIEGLQKLGVDFDDVCGVTFAMERLPRPRGWSVTAMARQAQEEASPLEGLPLSLETLFGLPPVVDDDGLYVIETDRAAWLRRHSQALAARIRRVCRNGSHQAAEEGDRRRA